MFCLNPCFNGKPSEGILEGSLPKQEGLNPCFNGKPSEGNVLVHNAGILRQVLILVLMESPHCNVNLLVSLPVMS